MSIESGIQDHIACQVIEDSKHQVLIIKFLTHDLTSATCARELGAQLEALIPTRERQYFVIDCDCVHSIGSAAFSELLSFVRKAGPVWVCNLDNALRFGAAMVGIDKWVQFAASREAAVNGVQRTAGWDEEDTVDFPARAS